MRLVKRIRSLVASLRRDDRLSAEMEEEFALHQELRTADLVGRGLSPEEAHRRARLEFGSPARYREEGRESRGLRHIDELRSDIRYAARSLGRSPGFAAAAILTLALGVAANAAIFSLISATLFRPLPFTDADRLVVLYQTRSGDARPSRWSYPEFAAVREAVHSVRQLAAYYADDLNLTASATAPTRVRAEMVSASYHELLNVQPVLGRAFVPAEDGAPGARPAIMLGHALWVRAFAADPAVLGRTVSLNGVPLTVVGVAPPEFNGLSGAAEVWIPQAMAPAVYYAEQLTSPQHFHSVVGRLAPGVTLEDARAELAAAGVRAANAARLASGSEDVGPWSVTLLPLEDARRDPRSTTAQLVLAGAAFIVMLIAIVNLTGLLLARSTSRSRELAVRSALGAGRTRLLRHCLVEGAVVGASGGAVGMLLAAWSVHTLVALAPERLGGARPHFADLTSFASPAVDWRVAGFAAVIAIVAGIAAGFVPALRMSAIADPATLRQGGRGSSVSVGSMRRPTVLSVAAIAQIASALVLLVAAGMLMDGFHRLRTTDPGFTPDGVLTFRINPPESRYGGAAAAPLLERLLESVQAVPGVRHATVSLCPPYSACSSTMLYSTDRPSDDDALLVGRHYVGPQHFDVLGIPLLRGRVLNGDDRAGRPRVAVINETAARTLWPGEDPIGKRVWFGSGGGFASPDSLTEIVGIAGDVLYAAPGEPIRADFYTSYMQFTWPHTTIMVRTTGDAMALVPSLRRAVAAVDADLPIHDVRTMHQRSAEALAGERFATTAILLFAALGLLLAVLGIYGIMAYSVVQRRREIGIRMALGAPPGAMLRHILAQGGALAVAGLTMGTVAALILTRALPALLPEVGTSDPRVFAVVVPLLLAVALCACYMPARAAMRIDPVETITGD